MWGVLLLEFLEELASQLVLTSVLGHRRTPVITPRACNVRSIPGSCAELGRDGFGG